MKKTSIETYKKAYDKLVAHNETNLTFEEYLEFCKRRLQRARELGLLI